MWCFLKKMNEAKGASGSGRSVRWIVWKPLALCEGDFHHFLTLYRLIRHLKKNISCSSKLIIFVYLVWWMWFPSIMRGVSGRKEADRKGNHCFGSVLVLITSKLWRAQMLLVHRRPKHMPNPPISSISLPPHTPALWHTHILPIRPSIP